MAVYIYILIRDGGPFLAFPAHLHLQIHMPTSFLSSYLAASAKSAVTLFGQIVTLRGITLPILYNVYRPFGEHLGPSSFCWPNLGCESPLVETPKARFDGRRRLHLPASNVVKQSPRIGRNRGSVHCRAHIREGKGIYGRERASILPPSTGGRLQISLPL